MNDADDDNATTPSDREPEPARSFDLKAEMAKFKRPSAPRVVSAAPAPISAPSGGVYFAAPKPSVGHIPISPRGFVAFANVAEMLAANAEVWRVPHDRIPARSDFAAHGREIEAHITNTNERAAGIDSRNGSLYWAPAATWRTSASVNQQPVSAAIAATCGKVIGFPTKLGPTAFVCYPILTCRALALIFGAENPPEAPPQFVLDDIREIEQPTARMTAYPDQSKSPVKEILDVVAADLGATAHSGAAAPLPAKRTPNGLDFRAKDKPLVTEMRKLIENGEARSAVDAARAVVDRAEGHGTSDSKVARLAGRYRQALPSVS